MVQLPLRDPVKTKTGTFTICLWGRGMPGGGHARSATLTHPRARGFSWRFSGGGDGRKRPTRSLQRLSRPVVLDTDTTESSRARLINHPHEYITGDRRMAKKCPLHGLNWFLSIHGEWTPRGQWGVVEQCWRCSVEMSL